MQQNIIQLQIYIFGATAMSHLRDLQRLRNTRQNFQIKRNSHQQPEQGLLRRPEPQQMPEIFTRNIQSDFQLENPYLKYLQSKEILTARDPRERQLPKTGQKVKNHRRGASIGIGSTYYDAKSRELPQSGLSVYNFALKLGGMSAGTSTSISKRVNPLTSRREKVPELFVNNEIQERKTTKDLKLKKQRKLSKDFKQEKMTKNSFEVICPVGKGGFGKVWKVRCKKTGQIFAMKEMQKAKIINKKSINSVLNERTLLAELNHPYLVNMKYSFQDRQNLYLVLDYLNGGDLRYHIGCKGRFSQQESKFFVANIIIGLEYLHERKIIHRDLKPQNFVFDSQGYIRITDLGVSRIVKEDNHQDTSGTPGYMAPEVICHNNHSFTADYFALGVMGYEFMLGKRPYNGRNRKEIRENMLAKQAEVRLDELPYRWSPKAADFINQLLKRNPEKRLGSNGIEEIKVHPWLSDVDWKGLREKTVKSVFIPLSIEENYEDYKEQISEDTEVENEEQTRILLRDAEVQSLFKGYEFQDRGHLRKKSTRTTNYTDSEQISLRGSGK